MAEKTVAQLQREYADITEKNRDAYDRLNGQGKYRSGISGSLYDQWQNAVKKGKGFEGDAAKLKAAFEEAQATYKKTQEAKNAAKAALDAATKAEKEAKDKEVSQKSAKSTYDKAMAAFKQAEATRGGYKGEEGYKDAYAKLQTARDAYVQAGGTPPDLPKTDITPATPTTPTTGTDASGKPLDADANWSLKERIDFLTKPENKEALAVWQKILVKNFGYKGKTDGTADPGFVAALTNAYGMRTSQPTAWQGASIKDFIFNPPFTVTSTGTSSGAGGTTIRNYTTVFDKTQAQAAINKVFQDQLGRDVTTDELKVLSEQLMAAQKANPTKYQVTIDKDGYTVKNQTQTGGLDIEQYLTNLIKSGATVKGKALLPNLKDEYTNVKLQAPEVTKLGINKKLYETAMGKAGMDIGAKQKVKETTAYGRGLKELNTQIADYIVNQGGQNTPDEIAKFAQDLYDRGYDLSSEVGLSELQNFIKYGPSEGGAYTGKAGTIMQDLAKTAMDNGLDLNKTFSNKIQGWLTDINKGEPIDNIKQQIREIAKIGMPDNVKKMIDNGYDLADIYAPYKSTMASVLELSPESINLSDPTLRAAITGQGEVPLYDFERALRKDNRWQYTNQARSEVSNAAQRVLQDFGFMG